MEHLNIESRRDLEQYVTDMMGENASDSATNAVISALLERDDMPAYGDGHDSWNDFLSPLDLWQIHENIGQCFFTTIHPNNVGK